MNSMYFLQASVMLFVAVTALAVVLTRDPLRQTIGISFYGMLLGLMFFLFQAPDVALSQITIGAVALPMMVLLGLAEIRRRQREMEAADRAKQPSGERPAGGEEKVA